MKTAPQKDLGAEVVKDLPCLDQVSGVFWLCCSPKVGEDLFFFWRSPKFDRKTASILFKTNEKLGQVRLRLYQTSKKAPPPLRNSGYAPDRKNARIRFITKMRNLHCLFYT